MLRDVGSGAPVRRPRDGPWAAWRHAPGPPRPRRGPALGETSRDRPTKMASALAVAHVSSGARGPSFEPAVPRLIESKSSPASPRRPKAPRRHGVATASGTWRQRHRPDGGHGVKPIPAQSDGQVVASVGSDPARENIADAARTTDGNPLRSSAVHAERARHVAVNVEIRPHTYGSPTARSSGSGLTTRRVASLGRRGKPRSREEHRVSILAVAMPSRRPRRPAPRARRHNARSRRPPCRQANVGGSPTRPRPRTRPWWPPAGAPRHGSRARGTSSSGRARRRPRRAGCPRRGSPREW